MITLKDSNREILRLPLDVLPQVMVYTGGVEDAKGKVKKTKLVKPVDKQRYVPVLIPYTGEEMLTRRDNRQAHFAYVRVDRLVVRTL